MKLKVVVIVCTLAAATVVLGGCATGSGVSGSQEAQNEAAWKRAEAHGN